jgi:hypothetical protein
MFLCHIGIGYGLQVRHGFVIDPYSGSINSWNRRLEDA